MTDPTKPPEEMDDDELLAQRDLHVRLRPTNSTVAFRKRLAALEAEAEARALRKLKGIGDG